MTVKKRKLQVILVMIFIFQSTIVGTGPQEIEDLLFEEIPVVVTASRKAQPITEAPTTITVISADDIKYSGATNIPDILRAVAGVEVMTISARDQQVGIRGFNATVNNKLLVLIDGRSVYRDIYGVVFWDIFPVSLEEIHCIEIVKSPASALYGANAYSGVINIVTKLPQELQGTQFRFTAGSGKTLIGSLLHAGAFGKEKKIQYKLSLEGDRTDEWEATNQIAGKSFRFNGLFQYTLNKNFTITLSGGRANADDRTLSGGGTSGRGKMRDLTNYHQLDIAYKKWKFRLYHKKETADLDLLNIGQYLEWKTSTYDAELLHAFKFKTGLSHSVNWGLGYRYVNIERNDFILDDYTHHLVAIFGEDEITLGKKFKLTIGGRFDINSFSSHRISPRGALFYSPSDKHIFRLTAARAFRSPNFVDFYLFFQQTQEYSLPLPLPPLSVPLFSIYRGNENLKPEGVTAYELGYTFNPLKPVTFNLNFFYNRYTNMFIFGQHYTHYAEGELFPGSPGGIFPKELVSTYQNGGGARGFGGEFGIDFSIGPLFSGFINYAFQEIRLDSDDPATSTVNEKNKILETSPKHKLNAGLRFLNQMGLSANLLFHWVGQSSYLQERTGEPYHFRINPYLLVNATLGYSFNNEQAGIFLSVFNLFNDRHYEYPPGSDSSAPVSDPIGRRIYLTLRYKF